MSATHSVDLLGIESRNPGIPPCVLLNSKLDKGLRSQMAPTFKMPPSSVLSSVKAFLPKLVSANEQLEKQIEITSPDEVDIENIDDCEGKVIEMNLALVEQADSDSEDSSCSDSESNCSESETNCSSRSSQKGEGRLGEVTEVNLRLPGQQRKRNAGIEILDKTDVCNVNGKPQTPPR